MNNNDIDYVINFLNETINSDILNPKIYDLKLRILAGVIDKKKHSLKNYMNINNYNSPSSCHSSASSETESDSAPINDSIPVSDFTIPSEIYKHMSNGSNPNTDRTNF